jgi:hypothetical protein
MDLFPYSYRSYTAQGTRASGTKQGQCCTENFEKTDVRKEASAETGRQKLDKEPRLETAAAKHEAIQQDPHEDPTTGVREASSRDGPCGGVGPLRTEKKSLRAALA